MIRTAFLLASLAAAFTQCQGEFALLAVYTGVAYHSPLFAVGVVIVFVRCQHLKVAQKNIYATNLRTGNRER